MPRVRRIRIAPLPELPARVGISCADEGDGRYLFGCGGHRWVPWEDFAECFAHYLHTTDTINTVGEAGLVLIADRVRVAVPRDIVPLASYADVPIEQLHCDWKWLALFFNRFNIPPPVIRKLGFVHKLVRQTALTGTAGVRSSVPPGEPEGSRCHVQS